MGKLTPGATIIGGGTVIVGWIAGGTGWIGGVVEPVDVETPPYRPWKNRAELCGSFAEEDAGRSARKSSWAALNVDDDDADSCLKSRSAALCDPVVLEKPRLVEAWNP